MKNYFFSIIMPIYNGERYLDNMLRCLKKQTFKDFELVAINDHSSDATLEILENFEEFPITIIDNTENLGPGKSRNRGINAAKGEWLMFVDADDELSPNRLEVFHDYIYRYEGITFFADYTSFCIDTEKSLKPYMIKGDLREKKFSHVEFLKRRYVFHPVISSEIQTDKRLRFHEDSRYGEDFFFYLQVLNKMEQGVMIPFSGYYYRLADNSLTTQSGRNQRFKKVLEDLLKDESISFAIKKQLKRRNNVNNKEIRFFKILTEIKKRRFSILLFINIICIFPFIVYKVVIKMQYLMQLGENRKQRRKSYHSKL